MYRNSTLPVLRLLIEPYRAKHENGMEHREGWPVHILYTLICMYHGAAKLAARCEIWFSDHTQS